MQQRHSSWNDPQLRNERLAMRYGWAAAMEAKPCLHQIQEPAPATAQDALREAEAALEVAMARILKADPGHSISVTSEAKALVAVRAALAVTPAEKSNSVEFDGIKTAAPVVLPEPATWTLQSELDARQTTTNGHLWFSNPVNALWTALYTEQQVRALLATGGQAQAVAPEWDKVRRGLTMVMLGFSGRQDRSESAAEAALDAVTEPGMPLAALRMLAGPSAPAAQAEQEAHDDAMDWDELPEDSKERARFNRDLDLLYSGDPRVSIATALSLWATPRNGQFGLMCAIFANEVAKLHTAPQAQADARDARQFWAVIAPCGEGVFFSNEADARWTHTGHGSGSDGFGVPTIGEAFRESYEDEELELVRVHIAAIAAAKGNEQ